MRPGVVHFLDGVDDLGPSPWAPGVEFDGCKGVVR